VPLSVLENLSAPEGSSERFWIDLANGQNSGARPSRESVRDAILFGSAELIGIMARAVPNEISTDMLMPWILYSFDRTNGLIEKIDDADFEMIPVGNPGCRGFPLSSLAFADLIL
jgi:hypothetical protein